MSFSDNTERAVLFPLSAAVTALRFSLGLQLGIAKHCKKTNIAFVLAPVQNRCMSIDQESNIAEDGLRYKRKVSGSTFKNRGLSWPDSSLIQTIE